jgi:hypothetical protein
VVTNDETIYEVVDAGERFPFKTMRQMAAFARALDRRGHRVRCQVRRGANIAAFKREAWEHLRQPRRGHDA